MCLAQGHNAVMPVRLEPAAPRSQVKHSTTEPLHSLDVNYMINTCFLPVKTTLLKACNTAFYAIKYDILCMYIVLM